MRFRSDRERELAAEVIRQMLSLVDSLLQRMSSVQTEADLHDSEAGRIVFTNSKGLSGVGFPRKGNCRGANREIGWEDIQTMTTSTVSNTIVHETLPGGPVERTINYQAPWVRCDRVEDYRVGWIGGGELEEETAMKTNDLVVVNDRHA